MFLASTSHDEAQPAHLKVLDTTICADRCAKEFGNPCQNFCPANVYEMVDDGNGGKRLQIKRGQLRSLQSLRHQGSLRHHHLDYT